MEILPLPKNNVFRLSSRTNQKVKRKSSKSPLKNLSLFWSALAKFKYVLIYQWNEEIKTGCPQESMQHKTQRARRTHLSRSKCLHNWIILKTPKSFKKPTNQVWIQVSSTSMLSRCDIPCKKQKAPSFQRRHVHTWRNEEKKKSPIPLLTLTFIFRKFSY